MAVKKALVTSMIIIAEKIVYVVSIKVELCNGFNLKPKISASSMIWARYNKFKVVLSMRKILPDGFMIYFTSLSSQLTYSFSSS